MKRTEILFYLVGAAFIAVALFGMVSLWRDHPGIFFSCAAAYGVVCLLSVLWDWRMGRELAAAEAMLASLPCPGCGSVFGREAASLAIHPPRVKQPHVKSAIADDLGFSWITCPKCGARSMFHRESHELQLSQRSQVA